MFSTLSSHRCSLAAEWLQTSRYRCMLPPGGRVGFLSRVVLMTSTCSRFTLRAWYLQVELQGWMFYWGVWIAVAGPLCAGMGGKKKKKMMYLTTKNAGKHTTTALFIIFIFLTIVSWLEFDRHELRIYEEVARVPPFRRKTVVLIGAQGVGRRSLKNKLMVSDPQRYGTTIPCECSRASFVLDVLLFWLYIATLP